jgi:hypothetical protein
MSAVINNHGIAAAISESRLRFTYSADTPQRRIAIATTSL